jgi:hypothetical protein
MDKCRIGNQADAKSTVGFRITFLFAQWEFFIPPSLVPRTPISPSQVALRPQLCPCLSSTVTISELSSSFSRCLCFVQVKTSLQSQLLYIVVYSLESSI